ncbi:hypothetical protein GQR58_010038 [Nymphon striatum]|nr:hypothetical protein GQR58_010038 [Nymphon striatum]
MSLATKKGLITRYRNLLEKEIVDCEEISEVPKITGKIEILKDYLSKFELAHENYLIHIESIDAPVEIHENVDKRVEEFLEFMEKITEIIGKLIETREKTVAGNQVQIENNVNVREVINQNTSVRLPKLEIPIFDGSILKWKEFWDIFAVTIHQNSRLSDIEKFTYLKSKLTGNVNEVIAGLSLTGANYSAAVTLLCERYGDNNKIIKAHYSQLLEIPPASNNTKKLRNTYDMISNHLRSLEALEQTIDNPMYIHLIQTKLPTNILTQMELLKLDQSWSTKSLCDTLKRILNAREAAEGETKEYKNPRSLLLHDIKSKFTFVGQPSVSNSHEIQSDEMGCEIVVPNTEGEHVHTSTLISGSEPGMLVTLRTIPVILKNGSKTLKVNALLDDGSTKTYVNNDIAEELGLKGYSKNVSVNVLNGKIRVFRTTPVQLELQSVNGQVKIEMDAYTTDRVTGRLEAINWNKEKYKWPHLREIKFPYLGKRPIVDILIGLDYADLHCSLQDICGKSGEPIARLTPLGWTCIGKVKSEQADYTNFVHTYFLQNSDSLESINQSIQQFWSLENLGVDENVETLKSEDKIAVEKVNKSIKKVNYHYEVAIPWKESIDKPDNNYELALKRLESTENKLLKNTEIANEYIKTIQHYIERQYVHKVTEIGESKITSFMPHFAVLKPGRETTKVRIVFDASARFNGKSLNDVIHTGPKLQADLFKVLLRFRKKPVCLVCDIAEMYLQIKIKNVDRPYFRFLWRDLNQNKLLELIPESDRAKELKLDDSYLPCIKTLGILWDAEADVFKFKFYNENIGFSKRKMLKKIAAIFDPLGFLSPYIIRGKILIQDMWISGIDWDKPLEEKLLKLSMQWLNEMSELNNIYIPRCLSLNEVVQDMTVETQRYSNWIKLVRIQCWINRNFLFGMADIKFFPPEAFENSRRRWRQMLINHFWGRWLKEWIPALNRLKKWHQEGTWPVGRVLEIKKGKDNKVRVAKVLVAGKTVVRPITKLCYIDGKKD